MTMKALYATNYSFYKENRKKPLKFVLLSDLHFSSRLKNRVTQSVVKFTTEQKPDYILFLGDIVHSLDEIESDESLLRLTSFFENLASIAPVIGVLGNHDFYRYDGGHDQWRIANPSRLIDSLNNIDNVQFLNNSSFENDDLYIYGFSPDSEYYCYDSAHGNKSSIFNPQQEDKNILIHNLKQIPENKLHKLSKNKSKLFLCHSPVFLGDSDTRPFVSDFDIAISGHMHNGVVPPALNDIWLSDRGIMAPGHKLFPRRTRNAIMSYKDPNIILGAIQTIQPGLNPVGILSHAFPIFAASLTISDDFSCKHRPRKKRQYLNS